MLMGFNLFASGFFTALNDGKTSAIFFAVQNACFPRYSAVDSSAVVWGRRRMNFFADSRGIEYCDFCFIFQTNEI